MTSFWNLPGTVTLTVALYMPSLHALASVCQNLRHLVGSARRDIIDDFLCSDLDVHCLGDPSADEFVSKPMLDQICRFHRRQPSEGIDKEVLFWIEAQLHLGLLCRRNPTSLLVVLRLCFRRSSFSKYSFAELFPPWRLSEVMYMCIVPFSPGGVALVHARGMGSSQLGRSVNEVLTSLWCMMVRGHSSSCRMEHRCFAFTAICFKVFSFSAYRSWVLKAETLCDM